MPFTFDPEIAAGLARLVPADAPLPPAGDVASRREGVEALQRAAHALLPMPSDVRITDRSVTTPDGARLLLRWYEKEEVSPGAAVLYLHGGGMILSSVGIYDGPVARYVSATGVPFLSVEYRYAPEHPAPVPVKDAYAGLCHLVEHAADLGVDPERIAIMGDSGGGGVAASLAIYARDRGGPAPAKQLLIYPMLDDRNVVADPLLVPTATWSYEDNATGWSALLGDATGGVDVSPYAAAARLDDFSALAPAYLEVSELDIFRDETIDYARRLLAAGVSAEIHLHPGVPHAFEALVPTAAVSRRAVAERNRVISAL